MLFKWNECPTIARFLLKQNIISITVSCSMKLATQNFADHRPFFFNNPAVSWFFLFKNKHQLLAIQLYPSNWERQSSRSTEGVEPLVDIKLLTPCSIIWPINTFELVSFSYATEWTDARQIHLLSDIVGKYSVSEIKLN